MSDVLNNQAGEGDASRGGRTESRGASYQEEAQAGGSGLRTGGNTQVKGGSVAPQPARPAEADASERDEKPAGEDGP